MARINVDDELRSDPRFHALCTLIGRPLAYGALLCMWELGQSFWKKNRSLIPKEVAELTPNKSELLRTGFIIEKDNGYYCIGAKERWEFLLAPQEAGRLGGLKSAEARKALYGTAAPRRASNPTQTPEANTKQTRSQTNEMKPSPSSSSSSSSSNYNYSNCNFEKANTTKQFNDKFKYAQEVSKLNDWLKQMFKEELIPNNIQRKTQQILAACNYDLELAKADLNEIMSTQKLSAMNNADRRKYIGKAISDKFGLREL
jgi:hypothetical protein